jgi:glycerol-3-phosphate dehydrogenase
MTERARVVVIGGGVVGCAIAHAFAERGLDGVVVLEAAADVGEGASKANSAILHTGFDAKAGTFEAGFLRRSNQLWPTLLEDLGVPYLPVGALMLARSHEDIDRLRTDIVPRATAMGVDTRWIDGRAVADEAPYVTADAIAALSIPGEGIVDPFWLTRAFAEAAIAGGVEVRRRARVTSLGMADDAVRVGLEDDTIIVADQVVDAAGLQGDDVAAMAGDRSFAIAPRAGQFLVSEEAFGVDRIVLPVPGPMGKGMLVTPIVFGGILLGPTAVDGTDKDDRSTDAARAAQILDACAALVPEVAGARPIRAFTGLRPAASTGDHIVRPTEASDRLWLACGIRSTGISASPAIAEAVADGVIAARGWRTTAPTVRPAPPPMAIEAEPGEVVCLCRGVDRGEIVAACARPLRPLTLDGVKRRGGATFGDCQGNLCGVAVAGILADALDVGIASVEKGRPASWLFAPLEETGQRGDRRSSSRPDSTPGSPLDPPPNGDAWDLVVVGAGAAGSAAAAAARQAGLATLVVDRTAGWTAIGLIAEDDAWSVEAQSADGPAVARTRAVLLASGGYVRPREQRSIAGQRPAGVMTADLVRAALAADVLPGHRAVVVGMTRTADVIASDLQAAGCVVVARLRGDPAAIEGTARLTGVVVDGETIAADSLVFADAQVPMPFLLRGLGLVDGRPGTPAPVDADGRSPLPGLWAAGCCVYADIDHTGCAADGARVAGHIVAALAHGESVARA